MYASTASACLVRKPAGDGEYFELVKELPRECDSNEDCRRSKINGTLWDASPTRWRSANVAPSGEQVYGLVTREWPGDLKEEGDREAWKQGKICIHEGWEAVWADPKDLIHYSQDIAVPRALLHYTASPSPHPISEAAPTS